MIFIIFNNNKIHICEPVGEALQYASIRRRWHVCLLYWNDFDKPHDLCIIKNILIYTYIY